MDQQAAIRDMMNSMAQGKASEVQDTFDSLMQQRANDAVNDYKVNYQNQFLKIQI